MNFFTCEKAKKHRKREKCKMQAKNAQKKKKKKKGLYGSVLNDQKILGFCVGKKREDIYIYIIC